MLNGSQTTPYATIWQKIFLTPPKRNVKILPLTSTERTEQMYSYGCAWGPQAEKSLINNFSDITLQNYASQ